MSEPKASMSMKANPKSEVSEPEASCSMMANPKLRVSEPEASMSMKANPKSEVSEPEASMGMEQCVCCQESMKNVAGCVCQAKSNRKSRKVISKTKLLIHTNS